MTPEEIKRLHAENFPQPLWVTGPPWGDCLSIHTGPGDDPHTGWDFAEIDIMQAQFNQRFGDYDVEDIENEYRERYDALCRIVNAVPGLVDQLTRLQAVAEAVVLSEFDSAYGSEAFDNLRNVLAEQKGGN